MGCGGSSAPQVSPASRKKPKEEVTETKDTPKQPGTYEDEEEDPNYIKKLAEINKVLRESVDFIIKCIAKIPKPEKVRPLVCLNEYTAPLAVSIISLTTGNSTEIYLPVAALSVYKGKHIVILGQIDMLSQFDTSNPDACAFLENSIRWTGGFGRNKYIVLLLGLDPNEATHMAKIIQSFDFAAVILDKLPDDQDNKPLPYHTIITTMSNNNVEKLRTFRGGLIIGVLNNNGNQGNAPNLKDQKSKSQLNFNQGMIDFMLDFGIGFPNFSLEVGSASSDSIKTSRPFKELREVTFFSLIKQYQTMTQNVDEIDTSSYDNLVTSLRYHIITLTRKENHRLLKLGRCAYEFLLNTNYEVKPEAITASDSSRIKNNDENNENNNENNENNNDNNTESNDNYTENSYDPFQCTTTNTNSYSTQNLSLICPSIIHCITVVLLTEILHRLPPKDFQDQHFGKRFPGEIEDDLAKLSLGDFKTHHQLLCECWISTGLYLPSGVLAQASISKNLILSMNNKVKISIQVGCHTVCTLSHKGPWKRWPIISDTFLFPNKLDIVKYHKERMAEDNSNAADNNTENIPDNDLYKIDDEEVTVYFCSPFGGIVYISIEEFLLDKPIEVEVVFRNLLQYPVYTSSEPSVYNDFMASINQVTIGDNKINYNASFSEMLGNADTNDSTSNAHTNKSSHKQLPSKLSRNQSTTTSAVSVSSVSVLSAISIEKPVLCPWMEIETQLIEISIPTNRVDIFGDLGKYCEFIDGFLSDVLQFTFDESQSTYRLVFDIELPNDKPVCDYPISMPMRMITNLSQTKPSSELLYLLYYVATLSIYQMNFGKLDSESIAMVAAFHAFITGFKAEYRDINPMEYMVETPPHLFNELWSIYTSSGYDCFAKTINDIREKFEMRPIYDEKKVWALFVSKISHYSGKQYDEKLIQKKEELSGDGSLLSSSSRSLLQFQLSDAANLTNSPLALPTLDE